MSPESPTLAVVPNRPSFDESVQITGSGFDPAIPVTIRACMYLAGDRWESWATFEPSRAGRVDVSRQRPLAGTYDRADGAGLLWSMRRTGQRHPRPDRANGQNGRGYERETTVEVSATQGGEPRASARFTRVFGTRADVRIRAVRDPIVADVYEPTEPGPHPTVIVLGGSEGGLPDWKRPLLLAHHGYAVVALAYFGTDGLPETLERIPLSYFRDAVAWIGAEPGLENDPLAAVGGSKGGELALLLGAHLPEITTVVGYAPSGYVHQGLGEWSESGSSWTEDGAELPYIPYETGSRWLARLGWCWLRKRPVALCPAYCRGLEGIDDERRRAATIPVERTGGPVLVVSGGDDAVWPAGTYTADIEARLERHAYDHPYERVHLEAAGHRFPVPYAPTSETTGGELIPRVPIATGGTPRACHDAAQVAWERTLAVLERGLRGQRSPERTT